MNKIDVTLLNNPYSIYFINDFDEMGLYNYLFNKYKKVLIITDDIVENLYLHKLLYYFRKTNLEVFTHVIKNGESSKNIDSSMKILNFLALNSFHRNDIIVSLGGGVVGDLSGFVASIYMRGIDFIQIPTTLLSAVDASIGGKTAIDIEYGKNLVGTFHQPKAIFQIRSIFKELPQSLIIEGLSEVIKYGAIFNTKILDLVESGFEKNMDDIIYLCAKAKAEIVSVDEKENGLRAILNFGHTFGHALEQYSNYTISHGFAVAYGMLFEIYIAYKMNYCSEAFFNRLGEIITRNIELSCIKYSVDDLIYYMQKDKKNKNDNISFALPNGKKCNIVEFDKTIVAKILYEYIRDNR